MLLHVIVRIGTEVTLASNHLNAFAISVSAFERIARHPYSTRYLHSALRLYRMLTNGRNTLSSV